MDATRRLAVVAVVTLMVGCGGGSSPTAPVVTQPPAPSQASITVTQTGNSFLCISPLANTAFRLQFTVTIRESAGLGANINFVRVSFFRGAVEIERQEIGANAIVAGLGSNRIAASASRNVSMRFDYNADNFDRVQLLFDFTDDRGNHLPIQLASLSNLVPQLVCPAL